MDSENFNREDVEIQGYKVVVTQVADKDSTGNRLVSTLYVRDTFLNKRIMLLLNEDERDNLVNALSVF